MYHDSNRNVFRAEYWENGKHRTKAFKVKEDALSFEASLPEENRKPKRRTRKKQNKLLLNNIVEEYIIFINDDRLKESTLNRYRQTAINAIYAFKEINKIDKQINALSSDDFNAALKILADKKYSESTIKKVLNFYTKLYDYALDKYSSKRGIKFRHNNGIEKLLKMPLSSEIKAKKEIVFLNKDEYYTFKDYCEDGPDVRIRRFAPLFLFLLTTGMRIGELLALKWSDIDFSNNRCSITKSLSNHKSKTTNDYEVVATKNRKNRVLTLYNDAINAIKKWRDIQISKDLYDPNGFICIEEDSNHLTQNMLYKDLKIVTKSLDINCDVTPHSLRHTFATAYVENYSGSKEPVDTYKLSEYLGHSSEEVTRVYYVHAPKVVSL